MNISKCDILKKLRGKVEEFTKLDKLLWKEVSQHAEEVYLRKNEVLVDFGTHNEYLFFIYEGVCLSYYKSFNGKSRLVWIHYSNFFDFFSTPDSFFRNVPSRYRIKALKDCVLLRFEKSIVEEWIKKYDSFNRMFIFHITSNLASVFEVHNELLANPPTQFIKHLSTEHPEIFLQVPSKYIAEFIGVTPEWFSKVKSEFS